MTQTGFSSFEEWLQRCECVLQAYKVSGEACYHLVVQAADLAELESFLGLLLPYGQYKVASNMKTVK